MENDSAKDHDGRMEEPKCYDNYPIWIVVVSNAVAVAIYTLGAFIIYQIGWAWLIPYVLYIAWLEVRVMTRSCVNCYYFGKVCAFGKGKLSARFFSKGEPDTFRQDEIGWKDIVPDMMVSLIPIVTGVVLLVIDFSWLLISLVLAILLLTAVGNGIVRGSLACKHCKQRETGCPAERLFARSKDA